MTHSKPSSLMLVSVIASLVAIHSSVGVFAMLLYVRQRSRIVTYLQLAFLVIVTVANSLLFYQTMANSDSNVPTNIGVILTYFSILGIELTNLKVLELFIILDPRITRKRMIALTIFVFLLFTTSITFKLLEIFLGGDTIHKMRRISYIAFLTVSFIHSNLQSAYLIRLVYITTPQRLKTLAQEQVDYYSNMTIYFASQERKLKMIRVIFKTLMIYVLLFVLDCSVIVVATSGSDSPIVSELKSQYSVGITSIRLSLNIVLCHLLSELVQCCDPDKIFLYGNPR
ncbi:hypothetical protein BC833DRAFT_563139 [Globomyces pollinis-pini]|nr:hypothetical protein BC833DRAFT_563139 [Globomyces pollinis-pini]